MVGDGGEGAAEELVPEFSGERGVLEMGGQWE